MEKGKFEEIPIEEFEKDDQDIREEFRDRFQKDKTGATSNEDKDEK